MLTYFDKEKSRNFCLIEGVAQDYEQHVVNTITR